MANMLRMADRAAIIALWQRGWSQNHPSPVGDGSLYFSSRRSGGFGEADIYRAQRLPDGTFAEPVNLGPPSVSSGTQAGALFTFSP